jgi:hypothetical protein
VKLPALKGGASREGISFYIVPLDLALKGVACGALAGHLRKKGKEGWEGVQSAYPQREILCIWKKKIEI